MVAWLVPLGEPGTARNHILLYDYNADIFYGPLLLGQSTDIYTMGQFHKLSGQTVPIDDLTGTIDSQTWLLKGTATGSGGQSIVWGDENGQTQEVDAGTDAYDGDARTPLFRTGAPYTNAPLEEASSVRVTVVYRQPAGLTAPTLEVRLSDDNFSSILATDTKTLDYSGAAGKIGKAYLDFIVVAERLQAEVTVSGSASGLEIIEIGVDATPGGVEVETT